MFLVAAIITIKREGDDYENKIKMEIAGHLAVKVLLIFFTEFFTVYLLNSLLVIQS